METENIYIFGAGVRALLTIGMIEEEFSHEYEIKGLFDDNVKSKAGSFAYPILGNSEEGINFILKSKATSFISYGTHYSFEAYMLFIRLHKQGIKIPNLISSKANVSKHLDIGFGNLIFPGVYIGYGCKIGNLCCIHGNAVIEHNSIIENNILIGPGVSIAGFVKIMSHSFLGVGSSVSAEVLIETGSLIGSGANVIKNIPPHSVAYGNPCKVFRETIISDEVMPKEKIIILNRQYD